ncbi:MAG: hypothetical protein U5K51_07770 [Flavobacteriaceae bacterium]|nr:hypothetical protein [Flavobacteriaceae bacterium]
MELVKYTSLALKEMVCHIDSEENYELILQNTEKEEFLDPVAFNLSLKNMKTDKPQAHIVEPFHLLRNLVSINSFLPLLVWKYFEREIKEKEFIATFKFTLGISVFPLFYILQSLLMGFLFGRPFGWLYLGLSFLSVLALSKAKK